MADKVSVDGATIKWKPMKDRPHGPKTLCYVRPRIVNFGSEPIGVVWADVRLVDKQGREYASETKQCIYAQVEGVRGPLKYGEVYEGDANDEGRLMAPLNADGMPISERALEAEVKIIGAYQEPDTGSEGQKLDE